MSILLYLPGLLVILFKRRGLFFTLVHLVTLFATQALFAVPFLREDAWAYARSAFDLGRAFLYKWTVNWRMFDEETFLSDRLATTLLVGHGSILIAFGLFKWCASDGGVASVLSQGLRRPFHPSGLVPVTADCEQPSLASSPSSLPFL
jgi:alpha-1,3-mannosyltransferase